MNEHSALSINELFLDLKSTKIDTADIHLIVLLVLKENDTSYLISHGDKVLSKEQLKLIRKMVKARQDGVPLAYILGYKWFYGRKFSVSPGCLIPRPESETIIDQIKKRANNGTTIFDIGTGSGCLAITLSLEILEAKIFASDKFIGPLKIAKKNNEILNGKVKEFRQGDLIRPWRKEISEANSLIIVANLPYVDETWDFLGDELKFEPSQALYAKNGGLAEIERLFIQIAELNLQNGLRLILETDISQQKALIEMAKKYQFELVETNGYISEFRY